MSQSFHLHVVLLDTVVFVDPWVRNISWKRKWQPTPRVLLEKFYGQRRLAGFNPWGHEELDTTEQLSPNFCLH